ncbi:signal recognition particle-docking protein FtsY [bacterium]|nr:MAG: signal recognition particle-docking protein FtsY [bacterium]
MGLFSKLKNALTKTRHVLGDKIAAVVPVGRKLDETVLAELEDILLASDVGLDTTDYLIDCLKTTAKEDKDKTDADTLLRREITNLLRESEAKTLSDATPFVILVVGVNGTGKTTSVAKLGKLLTEKGKSAMFSAADTFRAAAIEQLQIWGERCGIQVVAGKQGGDSAAVAFDALNSAISKKTDYLLIDTAGRLHNKDYLMQELEKVSRVLKRKMPDAPHEVLLVLDATTGQNGLVQAREFVRTSGVTGLVLTKIDGTAKGGIALAIAHSMKLPIRYVGYGEGIDDFDEFDAERFAVSLLGERKEPAAEEV